MRLGDLAAGLPGVALAGDPGVLIGDLQLDSRRVGPGTLFCCVPGFRADGHDFAARAVADGAVALLVERPLGLGVPELRADDARAAMAPLAARLHGDPTARLRTVGITGTNGKTTTAFLLRDVLEVAGLRTARLGTVGQVVGGVQAPSARTTPEAIDLQASFAAMLAAGDEACVMEVSSHALELRRADAIHWDVAVFTNLTQDHLDFHPSLEHYFRAKRRLFEAGARAAVVNVDDPFGRRVVAEAAPQAVTVGIETADATLRARDLRPDAAGTTFEADGRRWRVPLPGRFNVLNALGVIAAARLVLEDRGARDDAIAAGLEGAGPVPGRFEPVDEGQPFAVVVDYAHTPDSLDNVLRAARETAGAGRVLVVFGAGGERDADKRPLMGEAAAAGADVAILTTDNPRGEDPAAIARQVRGGMPALAEGRVEEVLDRRAAIERAVALAAPGDVVVVAGKGHEQGQEVAGVLHPFDDAAVAREALRAHVAG